MQTMFWLQYLTSLVVFVRFGLSRVGFSCELVHSAGRLAMASFKVTRERKYRKFESIFTSLIYFAGPPFLLNVVLKCIKTNIVRELLCIYIRNGCSYLV